MSLAESISRQLRAWAGTLQNSDVKGHALHQRPDAGAGRIPQKADAFMAKLKDITAADRLQSAI
jgi:predicted oxidoreductase